MDKLKDLQIIKEILYNIYGEINRNSKLLFLVSVAILLFNLLLFAGIGINMFRIKKVEEKINMLDRQIKEISYEIKEGNQISKEIY